MTPHDRAGSGALRRSIAAADVDVAATSAIVAKGGTRVGQRPLLYSTYHS